LARSDCPFVKRNDALPTVAAVQVGPYVYFICDERFHTIRKFNLLVEANFKSEHSVSFYAEQLCKSPKTLSNLFAIFNQKTPSQVIQERITVEAKRLLCYTDKSIKHITFELGFEDVSYFSNFFKKNGGCSPSDFRIRQQVSKEGK
jgi:AraC family transcriptional activator of pobA